jgi:hypothetical protein
MSLERERRIEQRAYALWEAEGYPHGKHEEHWLQAVSEIDAQGIVRQVAQRAPRRGPSVSKQATAPQRKKASA